MYTYHICWRTFFPLEYLIFSALLPELGTAWADGSDLEGGEQVLKKVQICTIIEQWITVRQKNDKMYVTLIEKKHEFFMPLFTNSFVQSSSSPFFFFFLLSFFLAFGFHLRFLPRTYLEVSVVLVEGLILSPGHPTKITIDYL